MVELNQAETPKYDREKGFDGIRINLLGRGLAIDAVSINDLLIKLDVPSISGSRLS